jgi:hypothetical protein
VIQLAVVAGSILAVIGVGAFLAAIVDHVEWKLGERRRRVRRGRVVEIDLTGVRPS